MKGEFRGADGRIRRAGGVTLLADNGEQACWITHENENFPAAVEALAKLIPEPFEWEWGCWSYDYQNGVVTRYSPSHSGLLDHESTAAFNAGRRYERERGHADE